MTDGSELRESRLSKRKDVAALAALALVALALFAPGLLGRFLVVRDMPGYTVPTRAFFRASILGGELPTWNSLVGVGIPNLATPPHGALYPGNLFVLIGSLATGVALTWAVHVWIAAAGGYALARQLGCARHAALIAALVTGMGGYAVSLTWNGEKTLPHAWLPWMAWAIARAARLPTATTLVAAAIPPALMCAAGDPFLVFDGAMLTIPIALAVMPEAASSGQRMRDLAIAFAVPLLLAGLFAAPVLLPAFALKGSTDRAAEIPIEVAEAWSLHPVRWLELFVNRPLGNPFGPDYFGAPYADDPRANVLPWAVSLYVGAGTFALATAARGRAAVGLVITAVVACLLAVGYHLPVHGWARRIVPLFAFSRYPEKHVVVATIALGLLAAMGASRLLRREADARVPVSAAVAGLLLALVLAPTDLGQPVRAGAARSAIVLVLLVLAFALARRPLFRWLPALVVAGDILLAVAPLLDWETSPGLPRSELAEHLRIPATRFAPRACFTVDPARRIDFEGLHESAGTLYGIDVVPGGDPPVTWNLESFVASPTVSAPRLAELFRATHVITAGAPRGASRGGIQVEEFPERSRAWIVGKVRVVDPRAAASAVADPAFRVDREAVVSSDTLTPELLPLLQGNPEVLGDCEVLQYRQAFVRLSCQAPVPALAILADAYSDGWHASVDGTPRDVVRADAFYRGVVLPAGAHVVELGYDPPGLMPGALLALLGALFSTLAIARSRSGARPRESPTKA